MTQPQLQDLLEAGVHFGHQTRRWNPKMRRFIFAERSGIYLIDLQKTLRQLQKAQDLVREVLPFAPTGQPEGGHEVGLDVPGVQADREPEPRHDFLDPLSPHVCVFAG